MEKGTSICFVKRYQQSVEKGSIPKSADTKDQGHQDTANGKKISVRCIESLLVHHGHGAGSNGLPEQRGFIKQPAHWVDERTDPRVGRSCHRSVILDRPKHRHGKVLVWGA